MGQKISITGTWTHNILILKGHDKKDYFSMIDLKRVGDEYYILNRAPFLVIFYLALCVPCAGCVCEQLRMACGDM